MKKHQQALHTAALKIRMGRIHSNGRYQWFLECGCGDTYYKLLDIHKAQKAARCFYADGWRIWHGDPSCINCMMMGQEEDIL